MKSLRPLKILIVSSHFYPETFRINDVALELKNRGHQVHVLTGQPNYPHPHLFKDFLQKKVREHWVAGVRVFRLPIITRGNGGRVRRILNYLSFVISGLFWVYYRSPKVQYDVVLTWATSPITSAIPAIALKHKIGARHVIWVQDLWPETLRAVGVVQSGLLIKMVGALVRWIYQQSELILIQSEGFRSAVEFWGASPEKIQVLYNWGDETAASSDAPVSLKPDKRFKILFAGNLGQAQALDSVLKTIYELRHEPILWTFVGGGLKEAWLKNEIERAELSHNVQVLDRVSAEVIPHYAAWADAMLVSLRLDPIFALTIPSKLQTYMAWGKPVLGLVEGESARLIQSAQCGQTASPSQPDEFAQVVRLTLGLSQEQRQTYGENGRRYYERHFSKLNILDSLESSLLSTME